MAFGILGLALGTALILSVVALILASLFIWFGVKVAGVRKRKRTLGNAVLAVIVMLVLATFLGGIIGGMGGILGILAQVAVIKYVYSTSWGKAIIAWIFMVIAEILVAVIAVVLMGVTITGLAFI
ncbi:MAG: hypothetical protein U9N35_05120 [Euryarchaeota archaeon]|nr:hypothetical protein [Euryarchaeota archaeon]